MLKRKIKVNIHNKGWLTGVLLAYKNKGLLTILKVKLKINNDIVVIIFNTDIKYIKYSF